MHSATSHNDYCYEITETRRGCYCWEGDTSAFYEAKIDNLIADIERLRQELTEANAEIEILETYRA